MKPRFNPFLRSVTLAASVFITFGQSAHAADLYWDAAPGTNVWGTAANWSTTSGADTPNPAAAPVGGDRAIFNVNSSQLVISAARAAGQGGDILFDTGAGAYTIGAGAVNSETFVMSTSKNFTMNSGVANDQLFNILLQTGGTSGISGSYTFNNNSTTNSMTFGGTITAPGSGDRVVAFGGAGLININGAITKGSATNYSVTKTGAGSLKINSTGAINSANSTNVTGSITGGGTLDINGGIVRFNGGTALAVGDNTTAGNVIVRTGSTLQLTGAIAIGQGASGVANTPVSSFTQFGGTTTIGASSILYLGNYRGATMDIQGGSLTSSSSAIIGVRGNAAMTISGANTDVSFTQVDLGLAAGSLLPTADLNLNGGTLTLGANGITKAATSGVKTVSFDGGTLRAGATSVDFVNADLVYVKTGGATINTNAFDVTIDNALLQFGVTTGALTKSGAGTLTLSGANTYTGGTTVGTGGLSFLNTNAKSSSGTHAFAAGTTLGLGVSGSSAFTAADITNAFSGTMTGNLSNVTVTATTNVGIDTTNGDFTYSNNIVGSPTKGLVKLGANTLTVSGSNTYTGATTISGGTLKAGSATAFSSGGVLVMANATNTLDLNGNNLSFSNLTTSGAANNTITTTAAGSGTDTLTITGLTTASGALFTDNGTRKLALSLDGTSTLDPLTNASNTFSGGLSMANMRLGAVNNSATTGGRYGKGTITIGNASQIYFNSANVTISNDLVVNSAAGNGSRTGSFRIQSTGSTLSGTITASGSAATFSADAAGSLLLTGKLTGTNGFTFNQSNGSNAWTLTLNNALANNDYQGVTTIGSANTTVKLGAANQIPNGANRGNLALTLGTLDLNGYSETINGLTGAGTIDNVTDTGGATNTLTLGDNNATGNNFTGTIKNTSGSLSVTKIGTGTQTLSNSNTYTGLTTVSGGILTIGHNAGLGATAGDTTVTNSAAALVLANGVTVTGETILIAGTGGTAGTGANFNGALQAAASATSEWAGTVKINSSDARVGAGTGGSLEISGAIVDNAGFNSINIGAGTGGTGTVIISAAAGTNTYTGNTTITRGTLKLGANNSLPTGTILDVDLANAGENAIFDLAGFNQTIAGLQRTNTSGGAGGSFITNSGAADKTLTINQAGTSTFSGVIQDGGTNKIIIVKDGAGKLTLSGTNTYTGDTTINGGTLALGAAGSIDNTSGVALGGGTFDVSAKSGGYTVNNLTGSGSVVGAITVSTTLAIGNSPGEISFGGDLVLGTSTPADFNYEFTGGATAADLGIVGGNLSLDSKVFLNLFQLGTYNLGDTFTLFAYDGLLSGTFIGLAEGATTTDDLGGLWMINYGATTAGDNYFGSPVSGGFVNITAVPEPNVAALLGALGTLILLRRRRA